MSEALESNRETGVIDPQIAAAMRHNADSGIVLDVDNMTPDELRASYLRGRRYWNEVVPDMASVQNFEVNAPAGPIAVRLYRPTDGGPLPVLLFCHGGGFIYGDLDSHDNICRQLASRSGWAVLAIDYHLAPEHRFPTPLEDVQAVIVWLDGQAATLGLDLDMVAMGGDSAGAAITLGVAMDLRASRPGFLSQLLLLYGNFGLGEDCQSMQLYGDGRFGLPPEQRKYYRSAYRSADVDESDPRLTPLQADLSGLPAVYVMGAELDPLHDNAPALAKKLEAANVLCTLRHHAGAVHGFLHYTRLCDISVEALTDAAAALRGQRDMLA